MNQPWRPVWWLMAAETRSRTARAWIISLTESVVINRSVTPSTNR
ncbi:hypothetical protein OWR29_24540 [Actinoplanes sp. Pm04-4]|uniref:Uncharacterized protein n=1 Tax=Paractinoplanes pyxinae TaxID=2997416 RepID=A0ABT4B6D0_9ACTN|nr:hypothetical protein [Actinoplanes pyxinae]MCY1141180.1 hypothetical protein [Actinoplanes pyxinae]